MTAKELDQLISSLFLSAVFMMILCIYFVFSHGLYLNLDGSIIYTYIVPGVVYSIYFTIKKLDITFISDICKKL